MASIRLASQFSLVPTSGFRVSGWRLFGGVEDKLTRLAYTSIAVCFADVRTVNVGGVWEARGVCCR